MDPLEVLKRHLEEAFVSKEKYEALQSALVDKEEEVLALRTTLAQMRDLAAVALVDEEEEAGEEEEEEEEEPSDNKEAIETQSVDVISSTQRRRRDPSELDRPFKCPECDKMFTAQSYVKRHLHLAHQL